MTIEEAIKNIYALNAVCGQKEFYDKEFEEALSMAIEALEKQSETEQFARWVAKEIFSDMWEFNKDAFDETACRKLAKLGIIKADGDEWTLVEPQESEK